MYSSKKIFITGVAGFIGYHLAKQLLNEGNSIIGLDNINNYYDINLKQNRINHLKKLSLKLGSDFQFIFGDLTNLKDLTNIFTNNEINIVIHLAAQAGVRYSLINPSAYINSNIVGFTNIMECCRIYKANNFIFASSSSVYGGNTKLPFTENDSVNHPISLYAATKKSNELIAHSYSHLYNLSCTGLRFFTVYGPWGRPDMAPMIFTDAITKEKPIRIFNKGDMSRDFTYIDDVIEIIKRLITKPAKKEITFDKNFPKPQSSWAPYKIFNIGSGNPINLLDFIEIIEKEIGKKAIKIFEDIKPGDVKKTYADNNIIKNYIDYSPKIKINEGVKELIKWYKIYFDI